MLSIYPSTYAVLIITSFLFYAVSASRRKNRRTPNAASQGHQPSSLSLWYIGSVGFFQDPDGFVMNRVKRSREQFSFKVMNQDVVVVRGDTGRNFFLSKGLELLKGYKLIMPDIPEPPSSRLQPSTTWVQILMTIARSEAVERSYAPMLNDVGHMMDAFPDTGTVDLFDTMFKLVFQLALRFGTCREFAEDSRLSEEVMKIFHDLKATPTAPLFPWVPTPRRIKRLLAGGKLYKILGDVIKKRKAEGHREDDPLQVFIDMEFSILHITQIMVMILFSSVTNTALIIAWILVHLQVHEEWKARVESEVATFVRENCASVNEGLETLTSALTELPCSRFESLSPSFDYVINETLRVLFKGPFLRLNEQECVVDRWLGSGSRKGTYIMFPTADLHERPEFYPNPEEFDPTRWAKEAVEERKKKHGVTFLGWGAGRHQCLGKRAAILMMKSIVANLVTQFDVEVVDSDSAPLERIPESSVEVLGKVGTPNSPVFLRYTRREFPLH
ncbi:hypothetical protein ONZ45_g15927 [Pleurotus djamor]|nr:hypothetical protein ONZ45_g15927 [Pleurotus djamor]